MAGLGYLVSQEIARRRSTERAREKAAADPSKIQGALAKRMSEFVPEGQKVKYKKHATRHEAVGAAIPKSDPRHAVPRKSWERYSEMMNDPRFEDFTPRDLMTAASNIETRAVKEATHKHIQKQKSGTFSSFLKDKHAPMPGQEEWEAEHPVEKHLMRAEISALWGAGSKVAVEAGKFALKKGPAARMGRRKAIGLLAKAGPYGKVAAAGVSGIVGMRVFEEISHETTEYVKKTEYGKEHPVAAELIGMGVGIGAGVAVPVEAIFGGMLTSRGGKAITKFQELLRKRKVAGATAMENPAAKEIIAFKKAEEAAAKSSDVAVATMNKDKVASMKRLVETTEKRVEQKKFGKIEQIGETIGQPLTKRGGLPVPVAVARPGSLHAPRISGEAKGLKIPERALAMEAKTPNVPALKPDGSLARLGSREVTQYSYKDIKTGEGFDRVLSEVADGKPAKVALQKVGEMEASITRHSKVVPTVKPTVSLKKKMSTLGYDADEVAGMNAKIATNIERFSVKKEPSIILDKLARGTTEFKRSKIDLSPKYAYHATSEKNLKSITEKGLLPQAEGKTPIAFATDEATAAGFKKGSLLLRTKRTQGIEEGTYPTTLKSFGGILPKDLEVKTKEGWKTLTSPDQEKLYAWAKTLPSSKRLDLVERGAIPEAVNRKIVQEQRTTIEGKAAYKEFVAKEAEKDILGSMGTESHVLGKDEFVSRMMKEKGALSAIAVAATTFSLSDIFSPAEVQAAGIVDLGRTLSGLTATILKDAKPAKVKDLIKEMKKSNLIAPAQVKHGYVLPEPRKSLNIIPNVKDVSKKASMPPGMEAVASPHVQFLYYTGVRKGQELMNNAGVQWGSCQGTAVWNSKEGHKTLMNVLKDFIPGYKSTAKGAIKTLTPVAEKYHTPMQKRAFDYGMAKDLKKKYEKEFSKLTKRRKFKKGEADEGMAAVVKLEALYKEHRAAYKASDAMKDEYQAAWSKAMIPFASKTENSGTRIFLAAEDTANFEHYPWLKDIITWEEKAAASKIKDMMEHYSVRVIEAGEKILTDRPFMHHAWHPGMKSQLDKLNKGSTLMSPPMTKLHSRKAGYLPMVPDAEYSVTSYLQDINIRLEAMEFWKKGEKNGWWAYKKWLVENPSQAPEGLIKAFTQFEKGFKPVDTSGGINKFSEKVYACEVARLLAFSASVPYKHALKLVADLRVFGIEGVKAMPKAASSIVKVAIKQRGGEEWLKKRGFGLDLMDEAVEAYTETGKLYRVVSDISPFRVNESMADKALNKFNEIGGTPTSIVERFDRALSVVAGMNMAAKRGMTPAQSTYAVFDTILKSNFLSGQLNPTWLRDPKVRLMMIFQGTPFKIMEQRIALHGRAWKGVGQTLKQLKRGVIEGEQAFKWEMIKQGFNKEKDIFGNSLLSQSIREMILVGAGITAAKYTMGGDLSHHFFHPPFFKAQKRDIAIGASPLVNASLETYSKYMDEDYDEFIVSTFFKSWFDSSWKGMPAPIPVNFKKAARLTENDIPSIYRDSKLRYLFGVPAWDHD